MKIIFLNLLLLPCILSLNEELLHYVSDDVSSGSYKYYSLMYEGIIKIQLISQNGDADLYASHTTTKLTYEPDHYSLQSTTCGEDIIVVPDSFKRPVSIGVYGHPSHELSKYTLLVYEVISTDEDATYDQKTENIYKDSDNKKKSPTFLVTFLKSIGNVLFEILF
ncbi:UPF0669 protein C6orf120 homolog [Vespula pensylvanica]|uniref:UPF0669 protein C6orf120 homolog n=1 Tax=Vespula pensylvanica TaxID=30213 RepID=UPI001CB9FE6B|nr:UPF0669 protein C6orf120 homolog [Vespula pensylvanica]